MDFYVPIMWIENVVWLGALSGAGAQADRGQSIRSPRPALGNGLASYRPALTPCHHRRPRRRRESQPPADRAMMPSRCRPASGRSWLPRCRPASTALSISIYLLPPISGRHIADDPLHVLEQLRRAKRAVANGELGMRHGDEDLKKTVLAWIRLWRYL